MHLLALRRRESRLLPVLNSFMDAVIRVCDKKNSSTIIILARMQDETRRRKNCTLRGEREYNDDKGSDTVRCLYCSTLPTVRHFRSFCGHQIVLGIWTAFEELEMNYFHCCFSNGQYFDQF